MDAYNRQGIQWSRNCVHKKAEFVSVKEKIGTLKFTQEAALIVQGIFGLAILGIFSRSWQQCNSLKKIKI